MSSRSEDVTIHLGVYHAKPFGWIDQKGIAHGHTLAVLTEAFKRVGISAKIQAVPSSNQRLVRDLINGNFDIAAVYPTDEIKQNSIALSETLELSIYLMSSAQDRYLTVESAPEESVATVLFFKPLNHENELIILPKIPSYFQIVDSGRAKAAIASDFTFRYQAMTQNINLDNYHFEQVTVFQFIIACSLKSPIVDLCRSWANGLTSEFTQELLESQFAEMLSDISTSEVDWPKIGQ